MAKERVASWTLAGTILQLKNAQTKEVVKELDLSQIWPDFAKWEEHQKFYAQNGVRQELGDGWAGTPGAEKLKGIAGDMTLEHVKSQTFAKAGKGGGTSYKANYEAAVKEAAELLKSRESLLNSIMLIKPDKVRAQVIANMTEDEQALIKKLAEEKGITL